MENLQQELIVITGRFSEQDTTQHSRNKENRCPRHSGNSDKGRASHEEMDRWMGIIATLENTVERLVTDGNRAFRIYQLMLNDYAQQMDDLKEEYSRYRDASAEEKRQAEVLAQEVNTKIAVLNAELSHKSEQYRDLLDRYEQLEEKVREVGDEEREVVKEIAEDYVRESSQFEEKFILSNQQMEDMQKELSHAYQKIEQLQASNDFFRIMNEELLQNVEYFKSKLAAEREFLCANQPIESIERSEDHSLEMEPSALQFNIYQSQEMLMSREKEVLNISQHYSKFNRTDQYQSKEKEEYEFVITDSNDRKSFLKRREANLQRQELLKIDDEDAHEPIIECKTQSRGTEVKEFGQLGQLAQYGQYGQQGRQMDPYHAFFTLLVQCEKMNSPHFMRIAHVDMGGLYAELVGRYVPYNLWQEEIKKAIELKLKKKKR